MEDKVGTLEESMQDIKTSMIRNQERIKRLEQKVDENMFEKVAENKARVQNLEEKHDQEVNNLEDSIDSNKSKLLIGVGAAAGFSAVTTVVTIAQFVIG